MKIVVLIGLIDFFLVLVCHALLWRLIRPKAEIFPLSIMFLGGGAILLLTQYLFLDFEITTLTLIFTLYLVLSGCYIQTYPAIRSEIPSLKIIRLLHRHGELSENALISSFSDDELLQSRVDLMERDYLIGINGGAPELRRLGRILAKLFILYRYFIGAEIGKG